MNFENLQKASGLSAETLCYYIDERLIQPLYTGQQRPEEAEYAEQDVLTLKAVANLRRLRLHIDQIRKLLHEEDKRASILLDHLSRSSREESQLRAVNKVLDELDFQTFATGERFLHCLAEMDLELSLPPRDGNHDPAAPLRQRMTQQEKLIHDLQRDLEQQRQAWRRLLALTLVFGLLSVFLLGFILAPYIFW